MRAIAKWLAIGILGTSGVSTAALITGHPLFAAVCMFGALSVGILFLLVLVYRG